MDLKMERAELLKQAHGILDQETVTDTDMEKVRGLKIQVEQINERLKAAAEFTALSEMFGEEIQEKRIVKKKATSLGEHFFQSVGEQFHARKALSNVQISAPEYDIKAASDTALRPSTISELTTDFVRDFVPAARRRLTVRDLLGSFNLRGSSVTYWEEPGIEGNFATVAEGAAKSQMHPTDPVKRQEALTKIAGFWTTTDEMLEDEEFLVSAINNLLTYKLDLFEEDQLLNGDGSGSNIRGLLNRSGIQTLTQAKETLADTIFKAKTSVASGSGYTADGVIINPADWETLRLSKDSNGQYYGGGAFYSPYGNNTVEIEPSPWGIAPVITPAIAKGTVLVGAFHLGGQTATKGGLRVEYSNSHADNFTNNKTTFRLEKRELLMVPVPSAFVKVTLASVA